MKIPYLTVEEGKTGADMADALIQQLPVCDDVMEQWATIYELLRWYNLSPDPEEWKLIFSFQEIRDDVEQNFPELYESLLHFEKREEQKKEIRSYQEYLKSQS